jgi:uncharacterized membrane protein YgcG
MFGSIMERGPGCRAAGWRDAAGAVILLVLVQQMTAWAQAPAPAANVAAATPVATPEALEKLVGPIALYPDDLIGLVLPASTYPLQIVQADRFLDARKKSGNLKPDDKWHETVTKLLNYPEVVKKMSAELEWTTDLGEAVAADQGSVLEAIQRFRRKVQTAGNLKTDEKQKVVVEKEVITIVQADPQVIYVPNYNPTTVVVYSATPVYAYYPTPYPVYYYPYPPGAAFVTGAVWGAAIASAWHPNYTHYNVNVNRNINTGNINTGNINTGNINTGNINTGNINTGNINRPSTQPQSTAWKPTQSASQVSSGRTTPSTTAARPGAATTSAAGTRPTTSAGATNRPTTTATQSSAARASGGDAFSGVGSSRATSLDSQRGAASQSAASASRSGSGASRSQAGGARGGGGGGGRAGGGRPR